MSAVEVKEYYAPGFNASFVSGVYTIEVAVEDVSPRTTVSAEQIRQFLEARWILENDERLRAFRAIESMPEDSRKRFIPRRQSF